MQWWKVSHLVHCFFMHEKPSFFMHEKPTRYTDYFHTWNLYSWKSVSWKCAMDQKWQFSSKCSCRKIWAKKNSGPLLEPRKNSGSPLLNSPQVVFSFLQLSLCIKANHKGARSLWENVILLHLVHCSNSFGMVLYSKKVAPKVVHPDPIWGWQTPTHHIPFFIAQSYIAPRK